MNTFLNVVLSWVPLLILFALVTLATRIAIGGAVKKLVAAINRLVTNCLPPQTLDIPNAERITAFEMITCTTFSNDVAREDFAKRDELIANGYEIVWTGIKDSELWMYLVKYAPADDNQ